MYYYASRVFPSSDEAALFIIACALQYRKYSRVQCIVLKRSPMQCRLESKTGQWLVRCGKVLVISMSLSLSLSLYLSLYLSLKASFVQCRLGGQWSGVERPCH